MPNPYGPKLIEHFRHPRNRGTLASPTISQEGTNPLCGDRVRIELCVVDHIVREARFTANACALCVASASVLTGLVTGAPFEEVETLTVDDLLRPLESDVPASRINCIRLPLTVMHTGLLLYRRTHGLAASERPQPVVAVVLAAGRARRFGAQKLLAPYGDSTVLRTVIETLRRCAVDHVVVVTGADGEAMRSSLAGLPVSWVVNRQAEQGMSSSIAAGMADLAPNVGAALVVLGDQPTLSAQVVDRLVHSWRNGNGPIVAPRYHGLRGNPVLFDRSVFEELHGLEGDRGARDLIAADPDRVMHVDVAEPPPLDLDTLSDYDELLRHRVARG
jgi:CTP:molybdopterin cytidylyltransferase MocA/NifU-like protein involved in Fe-S cluster formation